MASLNYSKSSNGKQKVKVSAKAKRIIIESDLSDSEQSDCSERSEDMVASINDSESDHTNESEDSKSEQDTDSESEKSESERSESDAETKSNPKSKPSKKLDKKKSKSVAKKKASSNKRTIMYLNDDDAKPVTAAGALIYKRSAGKMKILIMENRNKYEDIGGKIDPTDESIYHAAGREIEEETNGMIKQDDIVERLKVAPYIYVPRSKYLIFIVEATKEEKKLKKDDFGDREIHDDFPRTIGWIRRDALTKSTVIQFKMNWRMKSKSLFDKLKDIENQFKFKKKMF